jgi:CubicO group peptidase (beta-lactamase class C family)
MNGGISGNAGVFSDANDLAILAAALLNGGAYNGKRILSPQGVKTMTTVPESLKQFGRSPGWDLSVPILTGIRVIPELLSWSIRTMPLPLFY